LKGRGRQRFDWFSEHDAEDAVSAMAGEPQKYRIVRDPVTLRYFVQYRGWSWLRWRMVWKQWYTVDHITTRGTADGIYEAMVKCLKERERKELALRRKLPVEIVKGE
jgi:hypothetical protein